MKSMMAFGALVGFVAGISAGLARENGWPSIFWRASVGALLVGWLFRWWSRIWFGSWQAAVRERLAATHERNANKPASTPKL